MGVFLQQKKHYVQTLITKLSLDYEADLLIVNIKRLINQNPINKCTPPYTSHGSFQSKSWFWYHILIIPYIKLQRYYNPKLYPSNKISDLGLYALIKSFYHLFVQQFLT
jgi:hypothetical protein